jgi:uncharacterized protein (DUF1778 family)
MVKIICTDKIRTFVLLLIFTTMKTLEKTRFDTRLPKAQKEYFEYAASLGGFRTLTDFVIYAAQQQADNVMEKHNNIILSKKDAEVFFNTILNPPKPNDALKKAANAYKKLTQKP